MNRSILHFAQEIGVTRFLRRTLLWQVRKRIIKRPYSMRMPTGSTITLPPTTSGSAIYITQCNIDWGGERTLASLLSATGIFVDVGAHIGYYSLYMAPRVQQVWAFEPDRTILADLHVNCRRCPNVQAIPKALSHTAGHLAFLVEKWGTSRLVPEGTPGSIHVEVTTLDSEWKAAGKPAVTAIKVDVEGRDLDVLLGAEKLIAANHPLIFTEMNDRARLTELWQWLVEHRYHVWSYTRSRPGDPAVRLSRFLTVDEAQERYWTMIFLVPEHVENAFNSLAAIGQRGISISRNLSNERRRSHTAQG